MSWAHLIWFDFVKTQISVVVALGRVGLNLNPAI
jgi:hypothetical protein